MATLDELQQQLAALQAKVNAITSPPEDYYTSRYSGEELDNIADNANKWAETDELVRQLPGQNLLDNWYFGNPVNQRGQTEYTAAGYTIDRWKLEANGTVKSALVVDNGIALNNGDDTTYYNFAQIVEKLPAGTYIVSFLVDDFSNVNKVFCTANNIASFTFNSNVVSLKFTLDSDSDSVKIGIQKKLSGNVLTVKAAKLELGSQQTLAHQDADGNWVLNEIPDYGEQLRRCQRYFVCYKAGTFLPCVAYSEQDGWFLDSALPVTGMRAYPVNNIGEGLACSVRNINAESDFISKTITNWGDYSGVQLLRLADNESTSATWPYIIRMDADLTFSADL